MKKLIALAGIALTAVGCAGAFDREAMSVALQEERKLFSDDDDVTKIDQLKPQLKLPFRLAVVPPIQVTNHYWHDPRGMMEGERDEIMAWGEKLKKEGIVSEFTMIPNMLLELGADRNRHSYIKAVRVAAARLQADAVLFLRSVTDTDSYANVLAFLDITIVGMFLIPGHQREALTILEGMVIDNRNQYIYFAASVEGTGSATAPLALFAKGDAVAESRRNALRAFGDQLLRDGRRVIGAAPGVPYATPGK
jgi:rhombotail lipoprotein